MMVLVLGDNFEFFLQIFLVKIDGIFPFLWIFSHELFGTVMMLLPRLMSFSIIEFFIRARILNNKNLYLRTNSLRPKSFLT